jgi:DNA mismatch repair protein MLH1
MLLDYFSLGITDDGVVESIPLLLPGYTPNLDKLPNFLMRLGPQVSNPSCNLRCLTSLCNQVDWTSEAECFSSFFRELAYFYIPGPLPSVNPPGTEVENTEEKAERWQIEHVLLPCMRRYLAAPKSLLARDVLQVASLPDLYRVFERC